MKDYSQYTNFQLEQWAEDLWDQLQRGHDADTRQEYEDIMDELAYRRHEKTDESQGEFE